VPREVGRLFIWEETYPGPLPDVAFIDIETCGLADLPVFLVGLLVPGEGEGRLVQYMARDPSGEPEMLRMCVADLSRHRRWVSVNGRSFDAPRMMRRCRHHEIGWPECEVHRDLLYDVRRRWGSGLPDCRLKTVESELLGLERDPGDVPGSEVPDRYYDFVRSGERRWIDPVVEHNRRDVLTLAVLLEKLEDTGGRTSR
jgi:uncharacterized protein YprB with RNaseH-like and TPR domain